MRLALHMLVLNGVKVLERALRPLVGVVDEICFTDTGSTDGTPEMIGSFALKHGINYQFVEVTPKTYPEKYVLDVPSTWKLALPGPFTGLPILRDWAWARNKSLELCQSQYVMKLDADDEVMTPENIKPVLQQLDAMPNIDLLMCPYEVMDGDQIAVLEMYTRFWRNHPERRFRHVLHEDLEARAVNGYNWLMVLNGLIFRDWRDSPGIGTRIANRNFKVLLLEYERCVESGEPICPHVLIWLAEEGISVDPKFTLDLLDRHEVQSDCKPWASVIRARCLEETGNLYDALEEFAQASSMGNLNGMLFRGLLQHRLNIPGWREVLTLALKRARHNSYVGKSRMSDLMKAESLLTEKVVC